MVQQSKPKRANAFMTEYSPFPGTSRSKVREVTDDPCTKNTTGRDGSPGLGAPSRLRHNHSNTPPFLAQYSLLQIASSAALASRDGKAPASVAAARPRPADLITARRGSECATSLMSFPSAFDFLRWLEL